MKPKQVKACWDAVAHRVFLDVCIEEVNANNRPVQVLTRLGYENLVNLEDATPAERLDWIRMTREHYSKK